MHTKIASVLQLNYINTLTLMHTKLLQAYVIDAESFLNWFKGFHNDTKIMCNGQ